MTMGNLHQFKSQPPAAFSGEMVLVTPLLAGKWLATNAEEQRPISHSVVQKYADDMRNDLWQTTHQGIALKKDGSLCDGQHRLTAVIQSGCSVWMYVLRYTDDAPMSSFDIGRKRTAGDALVISGATTRGNGKTAAAVASALKRGADMTTHSPSSAVIAAVYETHRLGIDHVIKALPGVPAAPLAALAYVYPAAQSDIDAIMGKLRTNAGMEVNTGEQLLSLLLQNKRPKAASEYNLLFYKTLSACEASLKKQAVVKLQAPREDRLRAKEFPGSLLWANKMRSARGLKLGSGA